jgi:signal transduction histidine kinase
VTATVVGGVAVIDVRHSAVSQLDTRLETLADLAQSDPIDAVSIVSNAIASDGDNATLVLVSPGIGATLLSSGSHPLLHLPTWSDVSASTTRVESSRDLGDFRYISVRAGGGDWLLIALSTAPLINQERSLEHVVGASAIVAALVMMSVAWFLLARDTRRFRDLVAAATRLAKEDSDAELGFPGGSRDLAELRHALSVLLASLRERLAREANAVSVMQQFVGDASHELRTPLTVISGYTELLARPQVSDEQRNRATSKMAVEERRMEALLEDLLLLARLGEVPDRGERCLLSALVTTRLNDFAFNYPNRVTSDIAPGIEVVGRPSHLDRLVGNALRNIAVHTPDSVPVRVSLQREGQSALLCIEDGGPGLPAYGVAPKRFQRFDESRSRDTGGSGLGMSIMDSIATASGGTLKTRQSDLGGLAIEVRLPLAT